MNKPFCGERWEFSIAAYNEVGLGPFSEPKPGQCGQNKIQIRNFVVAEVARSWARLEWDLPILSSIITEMWIYVSIGPQTNKERFQTTKKYHQMDKTVNMTEIRNFKGTIRLIGSYRAGK